jgi:lipid-binding SYLF domain-containing protein
MVGASIVANCVTEDGYYQEEERPSVEGVPKGKQRVLKKIPTKVIQNAKGLCIFTTMRTGLWVSGSGGAGILVARKPDGTWSPPSGIMMHTVGVGFLVGVDIYDCVIVINSDKALEAFQSIRCTLGGEISAVAGPAGVGGILDTELHKRQSPLFTYIKSRGFYAGLQLDGTIVIERTDENERFYGERVGVKDILAGKVRHAPYEVKRLLETLKAAQGDTDLDESLIPDGAPPADYEVTAPDDKAFGIPEPEDPDPFGVLALQDAGFEIKEAGTLKRPTSEQFEFKPSPNSPIFATYRRSMDNRSSLAASRRSSWRTSTISSSLELRPPSLMIDTSTQTDDLPPPPKTAPARSSPPALPPRYSVARTPSPPLADIPETRVDEVLPAEKVEQEETEKKAGGIPEVSITADASQGSKVSDDEDSDDEEDSEDDDDILEEEEAVVIHEVHQAAAPQVIKRARVVQVAKAIPPQLPARNPYRNNRISTASTSGMSSEVAHDAATSSATVERQSPISTPSLRHGDSTSSLSSVEGASLEHITNNLQPKPSNEPGSELPKKDEKEDTLQALPASPIKAVPGSFE